MSKIETLASSSVVHGFESNQSSSRGLATSQDITLPVNADSRTVNDIGFMFFGRYDEPHRTKIPRAAAAASDNNNSSIYY